jgi:putative peptidoglycan lipid II flippase
LATALGATLVPYFSRLSVKAEWQEIRATLHKFLQLAFLLTLPVAIVIMVFPQFITKLIFQRGAFAERDVDTVSTILFCFALQLPFYVGGVLSARLLQALQANRDLLKVSAASLFVNIILTLILSNFFDVAGIALAVSLTYWFSFFALYFLARKRIKLAECA